MFGTSAELVSKLVRKTFRNNPKITRMAWKTFRNDDLDVILDGDGLPVERPEHCGARNPFQDVEDTYADECAAAMARTCEAIL